MSVEMSRHNQAPSRPDSPERKLTKNEKSPGNPGTTDRKQWENTDGQMIPPSVELRAGKMIQIPETEKKNQTKFKRKKEG